MLRTPKPLITKQSRTAGGIPTLAIPSRLTGKVIEVPASSVAALRCMRKPDKPRILWIDAIRIDQSDLKERGHQASVMSNIYRFSQQNLVYLGEDSEESGMAFDSIGGIEKEIEQKMHGFSNFLENMAQQFTDGNILHEPIECEFDEDAITAVFQRAWFKRLWVVQEAALAPSNICFCGSQPLINLQSLLYAALWLYLHESLSSGSSSFHPSIKPAIFFAIILLGHKATSTGLTISLSVKSTRVLLTSEPKDRIFAIVGLCRTIGHSGKYLEASLIATDYSKSLKDILRDATRFAIQKEGGLDVLDQVSHAGELNQGNFPSWFLRLDTPFDYDREAMVLANHQFRADNKKSVHSYMTGSSYGGAEALFLAGYQFARISWVSEILTEHKGQQYRNGVRKWLGSIINNYYAGEDEPRYTAFPLPLALALMAFTNRRLRSPSGDELTEFQALLDGLLNNDSLDGCDSQWLNLFFDTCRNRRFFYGTGGYFGLAPQCTKFNDRGYLLFGSKVPFVLRPMSTDDASTFQLVGHAYVSGVMEGQIVEAREAGVEPEVVKLI
ncbi:HET-domain-containing protein [Hypoxylon trugodes]|uniref:HET-domain-containing protein n=1 Tax=Hypoxylon trugodes TaxID=326681 RepID=UPI002199E215|nr:HET-domain-containing protein [Hypoxylon trugodes]KAI1394443.1 HET-domain-containing protein [Hypoxylon trugodes]